MILTLVEMKGSADFNETHIGCVENTHVCAQMNLLNSVDSLHREIFSNSGVRNRDSVCNSISSSSYTNRCRMRPSFS
jgi:hypothetical protein